MPDLAPPAAPAAPSQPAGGDAFESQLESSLGGDLTPSPAPASPEPPKPTATPAPATTPVAAKPTEVKPAAPTSKPAASKPDAKPATEKKVRRAGDEKLPDNFRDELYRTQDELKVHAEKTAQLQAQNKDYEARGKDAEALKARLDQRDKEYNDMQGELRALKREASTEFKKQYEEPFQRAANQAERLMKRIQKPDGTPATFDEFVSIYQTAKVNYGRAASAAREAFGDDQAPIIMDQVRELDRLETAKGEAFEAEKKGWEERAKQEEGRKVQEREQDAATWNKINEDLKNTVEDYRDPVDDAELAKARADGQNLYDHEPKTKQEHLLKFAHIRHRLGAYEAQKLQIARHVARIAELEGQIEESKVRQPGEAPHKPGGDSVAAPEVSWEDEARQIKGR